jgi:hypothetical protein
MIWARGHRRWFLAVTSDQKLWLVKPDDLPGAVNLRQQRVEEVVVVYVGAVCSTFMKGQLRSFVSENATRHFDLGLCVLCSGRWLRSSFFFE